MPDALDTCSWDLDASAGGPRRPSLDDMGGAQLEDDDPNPDPSHPSAAPLNQIQMQCAAIAKVVPSAVISVHFAAGTPVITDCTAAGTNVDTSVFSAVDNGPGDTSIVYPAVTSPPTVPAQISTAIAFPTNASAPYFCTTMPITNGVRVRTWDGTVVAADVDLTILVF